MGENRSACRILMERPEGRKLLGRPRLTWKDNIKIDHQEVGWSGMDWIDLAQVRDRFRALVNVVVDLRVP